LTIRIVRLGTARASAEGTRIGTVRRPPRGVPKKDFARLDWYDVWFPLLAPTVATMKAGQAAVTDAQWAAFARRYRAEMRAPAASQALDVLASLSHHANFSVGCYCENESRCHRGLLRALLADRGANIAP
jgi:uncharacterized protein YeaO (DUF488 family)